MTRFRRVIKKGGCDEKSSCLSAVRCSCVGRIRSSNCSRPGDATEGRPCHPGTLAWGYRQVGQGEFHSRRAEGKRCKEGLLRQFDSVDRGNQDDRYEPV